MESEMGIFIERNAWILEPRLWEENFGVGVQRPKVDPPMESQMAVFIEKTHRFSSPGCGTKKSTRSSKA